MGNYDDILHLPHHRSGKRSHMSMQDRAAQFSPFAALTGFDSAIAETGRQTDIRPELLEFGNERLDSALVHLTQLLPRHPMVILTCFVPDPRKSGGQLETMSGHIQKLDTYRQTLTLTNGRSISLADILHIAYPEDPESFGI